ncbi:hypothetical protein ACHAXR_008490, partial [Thalassiosira sp. AJA248-18]
ICIRCIGFRRTADRNESNLIAGLDSKIDEKRINVLKRYLHPYSVLLKKVHMSVNGSVAGQSQNIGITKESSQGENIKRGRNMASPDDYISCCTDEALPHDEESLTTCNYSAAAHTVGKFDIITPSGKLDVFVEKTEGSLAEVVEVNEDSPLAGKIQVGDKLIAVDDEDLDQMSATAIAVLLWRKGKNAERKITILRGSKDGEDSSEAPTRDDYTHIRIPYPGYDFVGAQVKEKPMISETPTRNRRRFPFFPTTVRVVENQQDQGKEVKAGNTKHVRKRDERRDVPRFCAICLGEFEISEKISWASNQECTHVFHQECIVTWLNTLGRKSSQYHQFSEDQVSDKQLLNYQLECPCCRQDFISKLVLADDQYGAGRV